MIFEGKVTNEALIEWSKRVGVKLRIRNIFNTEVTRDSIRHFLDGIGDPNPLWRDEEYAKKSSYKGLVAPPNWLYSVFPTWVLQGLPGVHAYHSGNDWTFYKPLRLGDKITPECIFTGFEVRKSRFAERTVFEFQRANFYNQHNELVATVDTYIIRAERATARKKGKYLKYKLPHPWTEEELKRIEDEVLSLEIRGNKPRFWEDVKVGEELKPMVKGPLGMTDIIAFCVGADPVGLRSTQCALAYYRKHPAWAIRDPATYALEPIYSVHYNIYTANMAGLPYPYDIGVLRQCWLIQFLLNWMGDEGWLKRCYAEYRRFVYWSDVLWFMGKVVKKYIDVEGEPCVDIETHVLNQRNEDVMPGYSTVVLPSRDMDYWPVKVRVEKGSRGR